MSGDVELYSLVGCMCLRQKPPIRESGLRRICQAIANPLLKASLVTLRMLCSRSSTASSVLGPGYTAKPWSCVNKVMSVGRPCNATSSVCF